MAQSDYQVDVSKVPTDGNAVMLLTLAQAQASHHSLCGQMKFQDLLLTCWC